MIDPILSSLRLYWDRLRAGRVAPFRSEIDPRAFEDALENLFIVETLPDGTRRLRLAGMKLCEMMGMEMRGMVPSAMIAPEDHGRFEALLAHVTSDAPSVVEMQLVARDGYRAAMLLMPMRSDMGPVNRVLGCLSGEARVYAPPLAFRILHAEINPVVVDAAPDTPPGAALTGFEEAQGAFSLAGARPALRPIAGGAEAPPAGARDRRHLRLVREE